MVVERRLSIKKSEIDSVASDERGPASDKEGKRESEAEETLAKQAFSVAESARESSNNEVSSGCEVVCPKREKESVERRELISLAIVCQN